MGEPARIVFQTPPLTFDRDGALVYTGIAPKLFGTLEKSGRITGKPFGRNGGLLYQRAELDAVTASLFGGGPVNDLDEEF